MYHPRRKQYYIGEKTRARMTRGNETLPPDVRGGTSLCEREDVKSAIPNYTEASSQIGTTA